MDRRDFLRGGNGRHILGVKVSRLSGTERGPCRRLRLGIQGKSDICCRRSVTRGY